MQREAQVMGCHVHTGDHCSMLFQPGRRINAHGNMVVTGRLAISNALTEEMGGKIGPGKALGKGSTSGFSP